MSKTHELPIVLVNNHEALAPSRHDWKIADWGIKPQETKILTHGHIRVSDLNNQVLEFEPTYCDETLFITIYTCTYESIRRRRSTIKESCRSGRSK